MSPPWPPDEAARRRIVDDLDATLFVEAGAGAGKTTSLVGRIVNLVRSGVPITSIAAITFTEKATAELRHRTRARLAADPHPTAVAALERLDHAPIGTLHSFARRILLEFPIEAGLPPGFAVMDEVASTIAFDAEWEDLLDRLLADPAATTIDGGRTFVELCEFDRFGVRTGVRAIADSFHANWDLVDERVARDDPGEPVLDLGPLVELGERIVATPTPDGDAQRGLVAEVAGLTARLGSDSLRVRLDALGQLTHRCTKASRSGARAKWSVAFGPSGPAELEALRDRERRLAQAAGDTVERVKRHRKALLGAIVARFVLDGAAARAAAGQVGYHDLLVLARRLITRDARVRGLLHDRYTRVLLDEFQDTDPIQLEIAVRLTSPPDHPSQEGTRAWRGLRPVPGRLFVVGDPKQSIYRFRRADIASYLRAGDQIGAEPVELTANFRSTSAVIDVVNHLFDRLISFEADVQPAFRRLDACRPAPRLGHGTVRVLGSDQHDDLVGRRGDADELRRRESVDVAATVAQALADGWAVHDDHADTLRPCRPGDICVLLPSRISLPALESSLSTLGVAYRAENSSVVYATAEIRHLLLALRAADDPTDALALVEALRSPLYGCSDVDLWEWARAGGSWGLWSDPPPAFADHPVATAIAHVRSVAERVGWVAPADLLAAVVEERRVLDLALNGPDMRDVWRRVRYVVEQARAWADAGGHGVRRYREWARLQASEARIADTILPEVDHDAIRIMTIHAAKGLEFPITILAGMTTRPQRAAGTGVVFAGDTWMLTGRGDDGGFVAYQPIDEQMGDAERRRLLYVGATRAADHLVLSVHRGPPRGTDPDRRQWDKLTSGELLYEAGAADVADASHVAPSAAATVASTVAPARTPVTASPAGPGPVEGSIELDWADHERWTAERHRVYARASLRTGIAATRLFEELAAGVVEGVDDPGLDKRPVDVDLPPWQRGRYGTSIGRAVHGVLQFCDLTTGVDIDDLATAQCAAEGVLGLDAEVAALARSALVAPIVAHAAAGAPHWRELFVAAPVGGRVLEGYVDLLVRTAEGLVIVDYKTDQWSPSVRPAERIARYRVQLAAYGVALASVLGEAIVGGILVRCVPSGPAEQIAIDDWSGAIDEVVDRIA